MEKLIGGVFYIMPLIFAFGFLTPVMAQAIHTIGWLPPFGLSPLAFSAIVCGAWGLVAQFWRRWI
ncbi:hypothetical protein [Parvibaculum sp.]|uniref:hypothetical protein n=1 Tax=Parvibaculum sp. TaxID=2024848 RepID=UPI000C8F478C|nr:hypothetical protein [Parvibaculum sp.]MAB12468.1 hypothetical protein [Parvibaculum sp.]